MAWLERIPTLITVAVLAGIFACLERHVRSARSQLCKVAWFLVFVHFLAQLFEPASGPVNPALLAVDWGSLQASAIAFVASVSSVVEDRAKRTWLLILTGVPSAGYMVLEAYDLKSPWPYVFCLLACFGGGIAFLFWSHPRASHYSIAFALLVAGVGLWAIRAALLGSFDPGDCALLGLGFALPGLLMCRNHWRVSPGFLTVTVGFLFWGAVFPAGMLTDRLIPQVHIPNEIWNLPKIFVAFGMILAIVEDLHRKDQEQNRQMQRFSSITSQLLSETAVDSLCQEIATALSEVTLFRVAVILLDDAGRALRVAGASGLSPLAQKETSERAQQWTAEDIKNACARGSTIGQNSFLLSSKSAAKYKLLLSSLEYEPNPNWNTGDGLLIPMRSAHGGCLGCIVVADPRRIEAMNASQLGRIELLTADLAVALELKALQGQLARQASHDGLTGAWNHVGILAILEREMLRAEREGETIGVIMIDVDHFKSVNDSFGHRVGDAVLVALVQRFATVLRAYDSLGRYGGEEFIVVAPGCDMQQTQELAERIRLDVANHPISVGGNMIGVTVSAGVATNGSGASLESLLRVADAGLYLAKNNGRNRVEPGPTSNGPTEMRMSTALV